MTARTPGELRVKFEEAVRRNDFPTFTSDYRDFLDQYPSFRESFTEATTGMAVRNAIFGDNIFYLTQTDDEKAKALLSRGRAASKVMEIMPVSDRLEFLKVLQEKTKLREAEIALTISADTGKPVELSEKELAKGAEWFDYAHKTAETQIGTKVGDTLTITSRPLGVAQVIGAYNYPYALAIGGIVGALIGGNGVIVSATNKAPDWVFPFMSAAREAIDEFSAKAQAEGKPYAQAFATSAMDLVQFSVGANNSLTAGADLVHFVGGDVTGNIISKSRGLKPTILELGGSNVAVIMDSAVSAEGAAADIAKKIYEGFAPATGQRCTAPRMLCVQENAEAVVEQLGRMVAEDDHHLGNPFTAGVKMGPLVDFGAKQKMDEAVSLAREIGATVYGGQAVNSNIIPQALNQNSIWVNPVAIDWGTVDFTDAVKSARIKEVLKHEIFGPLVHILPRVKDLDEAIAVTREYDTHGLAGAIFTGKSEEAEKYAASVQITSLSLNEGPKDRSPQGPHGHPGLATIGGRDHFNLYTRESVIAVPKVSTPIPANNGKTDEKTKSPARKVVPSH